MQTDPQVVAARGSSRFSSGTIAAYLLTRLRARVAAVRSDDPESGALTLEWVAIAIVLVTAALALAAFLAGKLGALESLIPN